MTRLEQREAELISEFSNLESWEERYRKIIELGKALPSLPDHSKDEKFRVQGCQSTVWLVASLDAENRVIYQADSDALIVRGLIAMLLRLYSQAKPSEILSTPPDFVAKLGLGEHLTPGRTNGLYSMVEQIMYYARAYQTILTQKGIQ